MPEQDNDRLEQFFRKAATRADVNYNEDDWKKLEARLDAADAGQSVSKKSSKITTSAIIGSVLLFSSAIWINDRYDIVSFSEPMTPTENTVSADKPADATGHASSAPQKGNDRERADVESDRVNQSAGPAGDGADRADENPGVVHIEMGLNARAMSEDQNASNVKGWMQNDRNSKGVTTGASDVLAGSETSVVENANTGVNPMLVAIPHENIERDLVMLSPAVAERNKQKAVVELPGAEEGKTREAQAMVQEEHASDKKKHVASPRLSLLLSFAPDFSGTSGLYSAPGKAYGAVVHYHFFDRWTLSAGVIKNQKQYTGAGEEYHPPGGYWKNNTNGVIPETIKGSCSILEYPIMVQYAAFRNERSNWNIGAGVSSYLMQTESYQYHFDQPNPGAKSGWSSRGSSRFLFNMLNFTIGYERQVMPGLMVGIEPYAKIPLEEIGWSNLKLFSTGASVTLRYTIIRKRNPSIPIRSRGPD